MSGDKKPVTLSSKAAVSILAVIAPIVAAFYIGYSRNVRHLEKEALDYLMALSETTGGAVYRRLKESREKVEYIADARTVRELLASDRFGPLNRRLRELKKDFHAIHITRNGVIVASTDASAVGAPFKTAPKAAEEIMEKVPKLAVTAPAKGGFTVVGIILLAELDKILGGEFSKEPGALSREKRRKRTMKFHLAGKDGRVIAASGPLEVKTPGVRLDNELIRACLQKGEGAGGFYRDFRAVEVLGASKCFTEQKWTLLSEVDRAEAMAEAMLRDAMAVGAVVLGLAAALFFAFLRIVVNPLKELSSAADELAAGNYDVAVPVKGKDEFGRLFDSFNRMAKTIKTGYDEMDSQRRRLLEAQRTAKLGNWVWNVGKKQLWCSEEIYRIFGVAPDRFGATFESFLEFVHPDDREFVRKSINDALYNKKPCSMDHRIVRPSRAVVTVHEEAGVDCDATGIPVRMSGTVQDVTEIRKKEFELKKFEIVLDNSINMIFITDRDGRFEYVNPTFEETTGYSKDDALGERPNILSSGETTEAEYQELWQTILSGRTWRGTFKNRKRNGRFYWVNSVVTPIKNERGEITHFLAVQEDITEKVEAEEKALRTLSCDPLTGLLTRSAFSSRVEKWILKNGDSPAALFFLNVDGFKYFNDTYGHFMGDEFLRASSRFMEIVVKSMDAPFMKEAAKSSLLARLGGDEFAVFLPFLETSNAMDVAQLLRKTFEEIKLGEGLATLTVSVGISFYPLHGATAKELFIKADAALHRAKELGGNRCHHYLPDDKILEEMHTRLKWKARIVEALASGRFEPWFQPIMNLKTGEVRHYEALARMREPDGSIATPGSFMDVAERFGLVKEIDRVITEKVLKMLSGRNSAESPVTMCLNLSGVNIVDEGWLRFLGEKIRLYGSSPGQVVFEITETAAVRDVRAARRFIEELKKLGCRFALDDFGAGFTSFMYLKQLSVDFIKIDGSFIRRLNENRDDQLFVRAMCEVARGLHIKTIAESVENGETIVILKKIGVDYAQGFYLGRPAPVFGLKT